MTNFSEISLGKICPSPKNPRKRFDGRKFDELVASIKQKGVIEPIIVRPVGLNIHDQGRKKAGLEPEHAQFEIVVGERRYKAAIKAGLASIPSIIRELTNDEAYDFMIIENLQREDLTEREEAESFKAYLGRHGEDGIPTLAEKTGISPAYIRSRVKVLELPAKVLKAWDEDDLVFGHLQQLLRVADDKKRLQEKVEWLEEQHGWEERTPSVRELRREIDEDAPALSSAFFKSGEACRACPSNSTVQKSLFDVEADGAKCLNPECFKKRQAEWLSENWKTSALAKKHGTNGFRFHDYGALAEEKLHDFYDYGQHPGKKCRECPNFVTVLNLTGQVYHEKSCAGERSCYEAVTRPRSDKEKATGERDPEAPRAKWHGEYFRDVFLSKRIPGALAKLDPAGPEARALLLACAIHGHYFELEIREEFSGAILKKTPKEIDAAVAKTLEKIILSGQHVGPSRWNGWGTKGRRVVAEYLGIDLAKEYAIDKEYLEKKTKAEIIAFGNRFKIFSEVKKLMKHKDAGMPPEKLKKSELIDLVLKSGVDLVGKVPVEILK